MFRELTLLRVILYRAKHFGIPLVSNFDPRRIRRNPGYEKYRKKILNRFFAYLS